MPWCVVVVHLSQISQIQLLAAARALDKMLHLIRDRITLADAYAEVGQLAHL